MGRTWLVKAQCFCIHDNLSFFLISAPHNDFIVFVCFFMTEKIKLLVICKWCSALCQPPFRYCRRICVENAAVVLNLTVFFSLLCSHAGRAPGLQRPKKFDISSVTNTCAYSFNWDFAIVLTFLTTYFMIWMHIGPIYSSPTSVSWVSGHWM